MRLEFQLCDSKYTSSGSFLFYSTLWLQVFFSCNFCSYYITNEHGRGAEFESYASSCVCRLSEVSKRNRSFSRVFRAEFPWILNASVVERVRYPQFVVTKISELEKYFYTVVAKTIINATNPHFCCILLVNYLLLLMFRKRVLCISLHSHIAHSNKFILFFSLIQGIQSYCGSIEN
jgi:hypothetical protein